MSKIILTAKRSSGNNGYRKEQPKKDNTSKCKGWNDILKEVKKRKATGQKTSLFSISDQEYEASYAETEKKKLIKIGFLARYSLGTKYGNVYFTRREAECMVWLLKGKTIKNVATILKLSPRTVEYYMRHMKAKTGCRTKFELIDFVTASDFIKHVDF